MSAFRLISTPSSAHQTTKNWNWIGSVASFHVDYCTNKSHHRIYKFSLFFSSKYTFLFSFSLELSHKGKNITNDCIFINNRQLSKHIENINNKQETKVKSIEIRRETNKRIYSQTENDLDATHFKAKSEEAKQKKTESHWIMMMICIRWQWSNIIEQEKFVFYSHFFHIIVISV